HEDAIALVDEVLRRWKDCRALSKQPGRILAACLIDLEKAFDLLDRQAIRAQLEKPVIAHKVKLAVEGLHDGTCYIIHDARTNRPRKKLVVGKGVRQGSVEGPALFIYLYDAITSDIAQRSHEAHFEPIHVIYDPAFSTYKHHQPPSLNRDCCSELDVSQVKFVDDLIALTICADFDQVSRFLDFLTQVATEGGMKVNIPKTELLLQAKGIGMRHLEKRIRANTTGINMQPCELTPPTPAQTAAEPARRRRLRTKSRPQPPGESSDRGPMCRPVLKPHAIKASKSVKYLGARIRPDGSYQGEITNRLASANTNHGRLTARAFKGIYGLALRVHIWVTLVRSAALYALE
ncbi:unnamed protein product, partial [Prorocentrum cordatum]